MQEEDRFLEERESAGIMTMLFGFIAVAASLGADMIGLGEGQGFGPDQAAGILIGVSALCVGWLLMHDSP